MTHSLSHTLITPIHHTLSTHSQHTLSTHSQHTLSTKPPSPPTHPPSTPLSDHIMTHSLSSTHPIITEHDPDVDMGGSDDGTEPGE